MLFTRRRIAYPSLPTLLLAAASCSAPAQRSLEEEIVPCPLTDRANAVLCNIIERCASSHGDWSHDLGPGCPRIWATQFGFTAGLRRRHDGLVELAEITAARENADLNRLIFGALFGRTKGGQASRDAFGVPALYISGVLNRNGGHYAKFRLAFDRALQELDVDSLPETRRTGLSVLLAQLARTEPDESEEHLAKARQLAERIPGPKFRAFALAAIARSSGEEADLQRARDAVEVATPEFRIDSGKLVFDIEEAFALSRYLALIHALADLAQLTGNPLDRTRAQEILAFVFSDHLFSGKILVHDATRAGWRSDAFCSGCNLQALYLVDRLYGDTFKIGPLPALPQRSAEWVEREEKRQTLFAAYPEQPGTYFGERFVVKIGYREVAASDEHPHGALKLSFKLTDLAQSCTFQREGEEGVIVQLDANDHSTYRLGEDSVVEGEYDPEVSRYKFEFGAARNGQREIRVVESYRRRS